MRWGKRAALGPWEGTGVDKMGPVDEPTAKDYLGTSSDDDQIEGSYFDASAIDEEEGWDWAAEGSEYFDNNFDIECIIRHSAREPSQVYSSGEDGPRSSRHGAQGASANAPPSPPSAPATSVATLATPECHTTSR